MVTLRVVFLLISLMALGVCRGVWAVTTIPAHAAILSAAPSPAVSDVADDFTSLVDAPAQYDIRGNEVDDAVGDYRVDRRGDEYEEHSPETEISRLGPPVS
jgi:hypothetical protein